MYFGFILGGYTFTAEALNVVHYNVLKPAVDNPVTDTETVQVPEHPPFINTKVCIQAKWPIRSELIPVSVA